MPARTPYSITGKITDADGSTTVTSGTVTLINTTLNERVNGTIESDGSFSVDAANTTTEYSDGDKLQIVIYDSAKVKSTEFRHTLDTHVEGYEKGTVYYHWTKPILGTSKIFTIVISNKSAAALTVDFYDRANDNKILSCDIYLTSTNSINLGFTGLKFDEGVCVIRESDAANELDVQMVVK